MIRHKQIHLGLTNKPNEMQVIWVSNPEKYQQPIVYYSPYPTFINKALSLATSHTYNVGKVGFHGMIYYAVMKNLKPGKTYYYRVGDE